MNCYRITSNQWSQMNAPSLIIAPVERALASVPSWNYVRNTFGLVNCWLVEPEQSSRQNLNQVTVPEETYGQKP